MNRIVIIILVLLSYSPTFAQPDTEVEAWLARLERAERLLVQAMSAYDESTNRPKDDTKFSYLKEDELKKTWGDKVYSIREENDCLKSKSDTQSIIFKLNKMLDSKKINKDQHKWLVDSCLTDTYKYEFNLRYAKKVSSEKENVK